MLERKIAATVTQLTAPPEIMLTPTTLDSGIPSNSAPRAMANPPSPDSVLAGGSRARSLAVFCSLLTQKPIGGCVDSSAPQKADRRRVETAALVSFIHQFKG